MIETVDCCTICDECGKQTDKYYIELGCKEHICYDCLLKANHGVFHMAKVYIYLVCYALNQKLSGIKRQHLESNRLWKSLKIIKNYS